MAHCKEIGEVFETHRDALFEWVISDFLDLPKEFDVCFRSPYIPLTDTSWYMTIYPNGMRRHATEGWIGLFLHRGDSGSPVTVHYQLGVKRAGGGEEIIFGQCVCLHIGDAGSGGAWYLCRATMNNRLPDLVPSNRLTVTCRLRCEAHHSVQGEGYCPVPPKLKIQVSPSAEKTAAGKTSLDTKGGRLLSSDTQTDISDITIGEENSRRGKDGTSLNTKGGRILSGATQTEISDLTIGEENSRREEIRASSDTKGFVDESVQTDGHVDEDPERTKKNEKIRQKFKLWMQQPDEGDCIRRLRMEHFQAKS